VNLNLTLLQIAEITNGTLIGPEDFKINNIVIDSRSPLIDDNTLFIALKGAHKNGEQFCDDFLKNGGQIVLVSKKQELKSGYQIVVKDTLKALQNLAKFHRSLFDIPVIGITGSNGKTIIKEWLYHVLKDDYNVCRSPKSYNSQIGVPLSVLQIDKHHQIAIIEAGISKPNEMKALEQIIQPTIGVFSGLGDAHQQNFVSLEQKKDEKFKLFKNVDVLIEDTKSDLLPFKIPFNDEASEQNAKLVFKTAVTFVNPLQLIEKMPNLPKISMRLEKMEGKNNNTIINDAYSLDDTSLEIGLKFLNDAGKNKHKVLFIAPINNYKFSPNCLKAINSNWVDEIVLIGQKNIQTEKPIKQYNTIKDYINHPLSFKNSAILFTGSRNQKIEQLIPNFLIKNHITKLNIDLSAIQHNLSFFKYQLKPETQILAMVKAQSYGGGIVEMAKFLEQQHINYFGVAYADEGATLVQHQISLPILVMNPEKEAFDTIIDNKLEPSIYSLDLLDDFISFLILKGINQYPIHIKLDTGMHRLGVVENEIKELINTLNSQPEVYVKSIFSHLAVADDESENEFTKQQINQFEKLTSHVQNGIGYDIIKHISNSVGVIHHPLANFDMVRLGIGLYGLIEEIKDKTRNALTFTTQISQIKTLNKGDSVGYGRAYIAPKKTKIAIIPVGYADGLRRELSQGKWELIINNQSAPIIGNICMDMCMIDISNLNCNVGDDVEIFGNSNSIFKMAIILNTIPYEIISSISGRVHRVYSE
jgi:alanine racemase